MRLWALLLLCLTCAASAQAPTLSPELQLCLMHLRDGERERLLAAQGPIDEQPLYRLELELDDKARRVHGRVQIVRTARDREIPVLYLRVTPNAQRPQVKLSNATVNGQPAVMEQPEPTLYRVTLDPAIAPGAQAIVEVRIDATVPELPAGSATLMGAMANAQGPRDYGAFAASPDVFVLTGILPQLPPEDAAGIPWDGPSGLGDLSTAEPAQVLATLVVPAGYTALASGVALGEVPQKDGRVRFSYGAAAVRDFPVVIARGYEKKSESVGDITVESWYAKQDAEGGALVLENARSVLEALQKRLGPLPHRTLRMIEVPLTGGAGGMEFSGAALVSSALYRALSNPSQAIGLPPGFDQMFAAMGQGQGGGSDLRSLMRETLEFTVAHELAHQYFAELVGNDPVTEPVVDEALAQYTALLYVEWKHGQAAAARAREQQLVGPYHFYRLGGGEDGPAARPTAQFAGASEYAALVYGKAPLLHDAERRLVGDAAFYKALRAYVDQYRYRWSCLACFTGVLAKQRPSRAGALTGLRERWWEQAHGDEDLGPPSVNAMLRGMGVGLDTLDPDTARLMQEVMKQLMGEQ
ncbi:MAG: aminopeptidase [Myxococcaceae bacterium]|nr:aminopeptidase [Myxococcaceae bacterium]